MARLNLFILLSFLLGCSAPKNEVNSVGDNSRVSVDWPGIYFGILPCADCEGIRTELQLDKNESYRMVNEYLGKEENKFSYSGKFLWSKDGNKIILVINQKPDSSFQFQVGEYSLWKLDRAGKKITGALEDRYILNKIEKDTVIVEKYWKLIELHGKPYVPDTLLKKQPHMILKIPDNRVVGNSGCSQFMGTYQIQPGYQIKFSRMSSTMMACPNMDLEREFLKVLEVTDSYAIFRDTLSLHKARMAPLARFVAVYLR
ncbi:MAG: copper resistance protein NlpE N-terminal domain-containing protein [Cyclobacteriaceae bacterium]|nr:copper resistance protein NlpE N-terminal domain-containing protein [Cyclobacteriaceae bacterium]